MLLVTDTLFIENFRIVHQGDSHIFRTTVNKLFKEKGIIFFVDIKLKD